MFDMNSFVMYGDNGVCQIVDKRKEKIAGQFGEYYILKPVDNDASTFYVPTDNEHLVSKMRAIMSKDEVVNLIQSIAKEDMEWNEDNRVRQNLYKEVFDKGDSRELLLLIKTLNRQKDERQEEGKRLWTIDETAMKHAEKLVYEEFATVLGIEEDQVVPFIMDLVNQVK